MPNRRYKHRKRDILMHYQKGRCFYCGVDMVPLKPGERVEERELELRAVTFTFEHLDDKFSATRGTHPGKIRVVGACYKCNQSRCHARQREVNSSDLISINERIARRHDDADPTDKQ